MSGAATEYSQFIESYSASLNTFGDPIACVNVTDAAATSG
jgi:hypothetical protein